MHSDNGRYVPNWTRSVSFSKKTWKEKICFSKTCAHFSFLLYTRTRNCQTFDKIIVDTRLRYRPSDAATCWVFTRAQSSQRSIAPTIAPTIVPTIASCKHRITHVAFAWPLMGKMMLSAIPEIQNISPNATRGGPRQRAQYLFKIRCVVPNLWNRQTNTIIAVLRSSTEASRERKCADIIGTVLVLWAGYFLCQNINIFSQIKYTEAILSNSTRKLLWFEINRMLIAVLKNNLLYNLF